MNDYHYFSYFIVSFPSCLLFSSSVCLTDTELDRVKETCFPNPVNTHVCVVGTCSEICAADILVTQFRAWRDVQASQQA